MSSEHAIIVARNTNTGAIELPLDDLTLYDATDHGIDGEKGGVGSVSSIIEHVRSTYDDNWVITLYVRKGQDWCGAKATNNQPR
ncbi:hypothetical protein GCM10010136_01920 [Limoniibacter endophyticus]|uniref:Uncharacterized protein n=2 Tax=Limoniibacter endophyticus TaxID=1565040 RepID=A0A8J3GF97_9HYPH|nr:hypothetical protein GCM10010136_01920 [Limoniibacter endophyticus]